MTLSASEWLYATIKEPWRKLPSHQVVVAMDLLAFSAEQAVRTGKPGITATTSELMRFTGLARGRLRTALAALERAGFCRIATIRGGGGATAILILDGRPFTQPVVLSLTDGRDQSQSPDTVEETEPIIIGSSKLPVSPSPTPSHEIVQVADVSSGLTVSRARDLDLLRSPKKDPGDPDLPENITSLYVPTPESADSDNEQRNQIELFNKPIAVIKAKAIQLESPADPPKRAAKKADADKITARAWMAADYLRRHVLVRNPVAVASRSQWEYGWSWNTGKPAMVGEGSRTGMRLKWAHDLLKFHGKLRAALAGGGQPSTDEYAWDLIARTIHWLFNGQKSEPKYQIIVDSPGSLIEKWDRIQLKRTSDQAQQVRQTTAVTAETIIRPKYVDEPPAGVNRRRP